MGAMQPMRRAAQLEASPHGLQSGFAGFFRRERPKLWAYLRRVMGAQDAEDATQEAFARVYAHEAQLRSPSGLLYSAARSIAADARRRAVRVRMVTLEDAEPEALTDPAPSPEECAHWRQRLERAEAMLERMSPKCRRVFLLRVLEECSYADIAERLGMSVLAVEKQLLRAFEICARWNGADRARARRGARAR